MLLGRVDSGDWCHINASLCVMLDGICSDTISTDLLNGANRLKAEGCETPNFTKLKRRLEMTLSANSKFSFEWKTANQKIKFHFRSQLSNFQSILLYIPIPPQSHTSFKLPPLTHITPIFQFPINPLLYPQPDPLNPKTLKPTHAPLNNPSFER